jgi:N-glycosylase/DNA lyase
MKEEKGSIPESAMNTFAHIKRMHRSKSQEIYSRLKEFKKMWLEKNDEEIFAELAFCILTPQSHAKACWNAIGRLKENGILFKEDAQEIGKGLCGVRFHNKKSDYIVRARKFFMNNGTVCVKSALSQFRDICKCREWLVKNINGFGYKEASHFLRNIGFGEKIAILDRHILKNLKQLGIIEEIPQSMSRAKYLQIEKNMVKFAKQIDIPVSHLDLLFWYKETGEIFK